jgi:hypothetical protein
VWVDEANCDADATNLIVSLSKGLFAAIDGKPTMVAESEEFAKRDSELIALEVEMRRAGKPVLFVELDIPGLE